MFRNGTVRGLAAAAAVAAAAGCSSTPAPVGPYVVSRPAPSGTPAPGVFRATPQFVASPPVQCARYARWASGIEIYGDAHTWWTRASGVYPQSSLPSVGAVVAMQTADGGGRGHVAVVRAILSERLILVDHANWHGREEVAINVPVRDVSLAGDWSEVNVWWLDTNSWGAKTYRVDGFIHPR